MGRIRELAERSWAAEIEPYELGLAAVALGAGRTRADQRVDPAAGIELAVQVGDEIEAGAPLALRVEPRLPEHEHHHEGDEREPLLERARPEHSPEDRRVAVVGLAEDERTVQGDPDRGEVDRDVADLEPRRLLELVPEQQLAVVAFEEGRRDARGDPSHRRRDRRLTIRE